MLLFEEFKEIKKNIIYIIAYTGYQSTENDNYFANGDKFYIDKDNAIEKIKDIPLYSELDDYNSTLILTTYEIKIYIEKFLNYFNYNSLEEYYKINNNIILESDIEEFLNNSDENIDYEIIDYDNEIIDNITYQNKSTDDLIEEVKEKLNDYLGCNQCIRKYTTLYVDDKDNLTTECCYEEEDEDGNLIDKYNKRVTLRIADHTHNPRNGKSTLDVVIANSNKTMNKFFTAKTDLEYDENSDADDIVNDIIIFFKNYYN